METDVDVMHEDVPTPQDMHAAETTSQDNLETDSEQAEHLSEWDSDSSFDFDEAKWLIHTPKFVQMHYNSEAFPYEIMSEGLQILYGYFFMKEKNAVGYIWEKNAILTKKKGCAWFCRVDNC